MKEISRVETLVETPAISTAVNRAAIFFSLESCAQNGQGLTSFFLPERPDNHNEAENYEGNPQDRNDGCRNVRANAIKKGGTNERSPSHVTP